MNTYNIHCNGFNKSGETKIIETLLKFKDNAKINIDIKGYDNLYAYIESEVDILPYMKSIKFDDEDYTDDMKIYISIDKDNHIYEWEWSK